MREKCTPDNPKVKKKILIRKIWKIVMSFALVGMCVCAFMMPASLGNEVDTVSAASKTPAKVTSLKAKKITESSITLTWNKAKNAKKYNVYQKKTTWSKWKRVTKKKYKKNKKAKNYKALKKSGKYYLKHKSKYYIIIKKTSKNTCTISGLKAKTKYQYKVQGINGKAKGKLSSTKSITTKSKGKREEVFIDTVDISNSNAGPSWDNDFNNVSFHYYDSQYKDVPIPDSYIKKSPGSQTNGWIATYTGKGTFRTTSPRDKQDEKEYGYKIYYKVTGKKTLPDYESCWEFNKSKVISEAKNVSSDYEKMFTVLRSLKDCNYGSVQNGKVCVGSRQDINVYGANDKAFSYLWGVTGCEGFSNTVSGMCEELNNETGANIRALRKWGVLNHDYHESNQIYVNGKWYDVDLSVGGAIGSSETYVKDCTNVADFGIFSLLEDQTYDSKPNIISITNPEELSNMGSMDQTGKIGYIEDTKKCSKCQRWETFSYKLNLGDSRNIFTSSDPDICKVSSENGSFTTTIGGKKGTATVHARLYNQYNNKENGIEKYPCGNSNKYFDISYNITCN